MKSTLLKHITENLLSFNIMATEKIHLIRYSRKTVTGESLYLDKVLLLGSSYIWIKFCYWGALIIEKSNTKSQQNMYSIFQLNVYQGQLGLDMRKPVFRDLRPACSVLISAFVIHLMESITSKLATSKFSSF